MRLAIFLLNALLLSVFLMVVGFVWRNMTAQRTNVQLSEQQVRAAINRFDQRISRAEDLLDQASDLKDADLIFDAWQACTASTEELLEACDILSEQKTKLFYNVIPRNVFVQRIDTLYREISAAENRFLVCQAKLKATRVQIEPIYEAALRLLLEHSNER